MVFNSGFDNSLWLILASDKKYRYDIADFIYNIPDDLYKKICYQLELYRSGKDMRDNEYVKVFRDKDWNNYFYTVNIDSHEIKINLKNWNSTGDRLEKNIVLSIYAISLEDLINIDLDNSLYIGNYHYNSSGFVSPFSSTLVVMGDDRDYEIYDNDKLKLKVSTSDNNSNLVNVNLEKRPLDFILSDLGDRHSVSCLVKGRKKR